MTYLNDQLAGALGRELDDFAVSEDSLPHRATVTRFEQTGSNQLGEPIQSETTVATDVPCKVDDGANEFTREDTGERVSESATVSFAPGAPVQEGNQLTFDHRPETVEVRTLRRPTTPGRGDDLRLEATIERVN